MNRQAPLELVDQSHKMRFDVEAYDEQLQLLGFPAKRAAVQARVVDMAFSQSESAEEFEVKLVKAGIAEDVAHHQAQAFHACLATPQKVGKTISRWYAFGDPSVLANATQLPAKAAPKSRARKGTPVEYIQSTGQVDYPLLQTKQTSRVLDIGHQIRENLPSSEDFAFTHAIFCQVALPHSRFEGKEFMRKSGPNWINVQAGMIDEGSGPVPQPIPYGPIPRLALVWISSYAVMNRDREVPIGSSAAEFLANMGMEREGRRYRTLRTQMHALAACRIQLGVNGRTYNGQPVEQFDAWINNRDSNQRPLWPGVLRLSETYYKSLIESAVPLDNRAMLLLKGSSLKLDIYTWMAHRLHRIDTTDGLFMRWSKLREQFGHEYQGPDADKNFKKTFLLALRDVMQAYPAAKIKKIRGGLQFDASPPPIAPRRLRA